MRLLHFSLNRFLLYTCILVLISLPVAFLIVRHILDADTNSFLRLHRNEFIKHVKSFENLDDLEVDLTVVTQLNYDIDIVPDATLYPETFQDVSRFDSLENEFKPYRELTSSINIKDKPYRLTVRTSLVGDDELVQGIGTVIIGLILALGLGFFIINSYLSRKLWQPFYNTLNRLKAYELDKNVTFHYENTNIVEFDDLNTAIRDLTNKNREIFMQQKEFIENASHELQTPLAIFQSKLDLLIQQPELTEVQAKLIEDLNGTAQRMSRLNKNLLLLSRIENGQFNQTEEIEVGSVIHHTVQNLLPFIEAKDISLSTDIKPLKITANKTLIEVLLNNLLINAVRHNYQGGDLTLKFDGRTIEVSNTSQIPPLSLEKVLQRFAKKSNDPESSGLGLALVKKICSICHFDIDYQFENTRHKFIISLP
jgi:signal transduction histidine kinase